MSDLINRQAVLDALDLLDEDWRNIMAYKVEKIPSAEPERKKGKWIHDGRDFPHGVDWIHCSVCGKKGINVPADLTSFCPNCGADMRGEEDEL